MNDKERMDLICAIRDIQTDLDRAEKRFVGHITEYLFDVQRFHNAINESLNDLVRLLSEEKED